MAPGPEQPTGPSTAQRRASALRELCIELCARAKIHRWIGWDNEFVDKLLEEACIQRECCPAHTRVRQDLRRLVGLCDRSYRTAATASTTLPGDGAPMKRTPEFECARATFRGRSTSVEDKFDDADAFVAFTETMIEKHVPDDAYGSPGDVIALERDVLRSLMQAVLQSNKLCDQVLRARLFGDENGQVRVKSLTDVAEALSNFVRRLQAPNLDSFWQKLEARSRWLKAMWSTFDLLKARVKAKIDKQNAKRAAEADGLSPPTLWLDVCNDDMLHNIAKFLSMDSAAACVSTCKAFRSMECFVLRMPHLRVRPVLGAFPHYRSVCRDRAALASGDKKCTTRNFVVSRNAVRLFVDFVVETSRPRPLQKKARADGRDNRYTDFSDDEYEAPPESKALHAPVCPPSGFPTGTDEDRRYIRRHIKETREWQDAEGPEESYDRFSYYRRYPYTQFFVAPLNLSATLVFADTLEPVPSSWKGGIHMSNKMANDGGVFRQPHRRIFSTLDECERQVPAQAKFHIPHLTMENNNRLFKLQITGTGRLASTVVPSKKRGYGKEETKVVEGAPFSQTVYTAPFEVVSKVEVVRHAPKRQTKEEASLNRRVKAASAKRPKF